MCTQPAYVAELRRLHELPCGLTDEEFNNALHVFDALGDQDQKNAVMWFTNDAYRLRYVRVMLKRNLEGVLKTSTTACHTSARMEALDAKKPEPAAHKPIRARPNVSTASLLEPLLSDDSLP
eukprot:CAMPEP_0202890168 /NCGR_PEP_ID=MMETSP1392-20130828/672_1 /ASSEMBLY_ACC=CAM_ASM_000868 /TAXON_ID=225041 /ORGANISM="Chlamydomonas chlamydogama, Strain SAG 11-48b" /LENGTH=121 /DNA_ID=CAMNT_0049573693 /DNA_START=276 /DNA_END=641 /DNA_ORIENTATION=+